MTSRTIVVATAVLWAAASTANAGQAEPLTLQQAETRALDDNPRIRAGHYTSLAAGEVARESRSALFPMVTGSLTGAGAPDGTRIAAGGLNNPTILDRFAAGFSMSQLLTDFGRTRDLTEGHLLRADAQEQEAVNQRTSVLVEVDRAYFDALRAQAVLRVSQQAVEARQLVVDQVEALAASGLRSALDVSFARVNLGQARLLAVEAENNLQAAFAVLTSSLGSSAFTTYALAEEPMAPPPPTPRDALVAQALRDRPDVAGRRLADQAAAKFAQAERAAWMPAVSLVGAAGVSPYHQLGLNDRYSALGVNVTVPVTNGNLFSARRAEAAYRAQAETQELHDLENRVTRDVTVAWLAVQSAFQRVGLTNDLLAQASDALELAQARYNLGLSSIVELTQAQLNKTQAELDQAAARYEYQARSAVLQVQVGARR